MSQPTATSSVWSGDTTLRLLPLYGTIRLPSLTSSVLKEHRALGANAVLVCITEEDFLYYRENITKVIIVAQMMGFRVYANAWGYGGLMGGEALSASDLHYRLVGKRHFLNSVHKYGPDAEITASAEAITESPVYQIKRLMDLVAAAGADTFFFDEFKIERPGRPEAGHVPVEVFVELAEYAHDRGLRTSLCIAVLGEPDIELLERLAALGCLDEVGFTRYYSPGRYDPEPEAYIGPVVDRVRAAVQRDGRAIDILGWVQGFDLKDRGDLLVKGAQAWRDHGATGLGIWGGFCVNETPMLTPAGHSTMYRQIAEVFGGSYREADQLDPMLQVNDKTD